MIRVQSSDFHAAAKAAKDADKSIIRALRKGLRESGKETTAAVKSAIGTIPSKGTGSTGIRTALQAGTRVSISTASPRTAGVRIVTDPRRLPAGKKPLAKAMNKRTFRHPVYGTDRWVNQSGRPYFGAVIMAHQSAMSTNVWRALNRAEREVMAQQKEAAADAR